MGVNTQQLVILGVSVPMDKVEYEQIEDFSFSYWEKPKDICCAYDGMSGDYCIIGKPLAYTYEDKEYFANDPIKLNNFESDRAEIVNFIEEKLGLKHSTNDVNLYAITHHS